MSLLSDVEDFIAAIDADGAEIAEGLTRAGCSVYALRLGPEGHVAVDRSGTLLRDSWGQGTRDPAKARSIMQRNPGALVGVTRASSSGRVVVVPTSKRVEPERRIVTLSQHAPNERKKDAPATLKVRRPPARLRQPPSTTEAMAAVRKEMRDKVQLEREVASRHRTVATIALRRSEAESALARARKRFGDAAADAVARGEDIPEQPRLRVAIKKREAEIAACVAALPSARERIKPFTDDLADHEQHLVRVMLDLDAAITAEALPRVVKALSRIAEPLAQLASVSLTREELLGKRFQFDARCHAPPLGARELVAALVEAIPTVMRPDELSVENLEKRAAEIASRRSSDLNLEES